MCCVSKVGIRESDSIFGSCGGLDVQVRIQVDDLGWASPFLLEGRRPHSG